MPNHNGTTSRSSNEEGSSDSDLGKPVGNDMATNEQPRAVDNQLFEKQNPFATDAKDERVEITQAQCEGHLGYDFSELKKWLILSVIFTVQVSMVGFQPNPL